MLNMALASTTTSAILTVGLSAYAALILASLAVTIDSAVRHRRRRAIVAAVVVGVLTLGGVLMAIVSSVV